MVNNLIVHNWWMDVGWDGLSVWVGVGAGGVHHIWMLEVLYLKMKVFGGQILKVASWGGGIVICYVRVELLNK